MNERRSAAAAALLALALGAAPLPAVGAESRVGPPPRPQASAQGQTSYATPEQAAEAVYGVIRSHDLRSMYRVLGPGSDRLIYTGDDVADRRMRERFLAAYDQAHKIEARGGAKAALLLGENQSPFPFPLVRDARGWHFDARSGAEELVNRRIGENELFAIRFCLAYGDAQREYAEQDRDGDGRIEYAQKSRSSPGKRDGLYWPSAEGEPSSPLGPFAARAQREGYAVKDDKPAPYRGYHFRILTGQGKDAPGGAYDYLVRGDMIGGYALVAYPARWGASGVMTFLCNHDGIVYQKNLGPGTARTAARMTRFNPHRSWRKAE